MRTPNTSSDCDGPTAAQASTARAVAGGIWRSLGGIVGYLCTIAETRRQRRALLALDDRMLSDLGLSRGDAHREASRSLLDLPRS